MAGGFFGGFAPFGGGDGGMPGMGMGGMGMGGGFFPGQALGRFDTQYQAFPVSFLGKDELEKGNKIILPASALDHLARLNISYPMLFECNNPNSARKTHCGVQEFIAEEGTVYLPYWMMKNLCLSEGDLCRITNTTLPKGSYVKLQPISSDFLEIHNPRAVLENTLRNFATLTVGDNIVINYNSKHFEIEIVECKPAKAISIIEADVNVDFAPPKFMKEAPPPEPEDVKFNQPITQEPEDVPMQDAAPASKLFCGSGQRIDGKAIKAMSPGLGPQTAPVVDEFATMPWKKRIPGGVKHTQPPYGYKTGHMTGKKLGTGAGGAGAPVSDFPQAGGNVTGHG